jgi:zinc-finger binding domain of transposase IS66/Transposase C of IS166 homeodomain
MAQDAVAAEVLIAKLKFQLARYRRAEFGRSSEKVAREAEQLERAIEALETDQAKRLATASPLVAAVETAAEAQKPARRPLPEHLPREEMRHPAPCTCPSCGSALCKIGDEVTETLDYVPGRFRVVRHIREKLSCRACDTVIAAPAPDRAIARGRAGAGLLAHIVVSEKLRTTYRFCDRAWLVRCCCPASRAMLLSVVGVAATCGLRRRSAQISTPCSKQLRQMRARLTLVPARDVAAWMLSTAATLMAIIPSIARRTLRLLPSGTVSETATW